MDQYLGQVYDPWRRQDLQAYYDRRRSGQDLRAYYDPRRSGQELQQAYYDPRRNGPGGVYGGKQVGTGNYANRDNKIQVFKVYVNNNYNLRHPCSVEDEEEEDEKEEEEESEGEEERCYLLARAQRLSISSYDRA